MAAPIQLPRLHDRDGLFDEGVRSSKRAKYAPEQKFSKQSTSFAALEEDEDVLRHGIKPFLKLKHPHTVYHADFNKYSEQYLLLDTTSVHFWTKTGQYIKSCKINTFFTNFISVPLNDCLIAWSLNADCLKILGPDFKFLGSVECPSSVKSVIYNDSTDELLTGGQGNFTVWSFRKLKAQKLVRKSVIIVGIDPTDELQQLMVEDVIGPAQRCFAVSSKRVYIFDIYGGKMLMCLDNLHKHQITSCIFVSNLTYLISSSMSGSIKVWDESWSLKHVFVGHCAKVTQLLYYVPDNCIISASVDKTIRLWSLVFLDLMQCIQTWSMTLGLGILPDNSTLYSFGDKGVEVWEITTLHKKLGSTSSEIKTMGCTTSPRVPTRLIVTLEDKSLAVLSPVTGEVLELCYLPTTPPPPSSPSLESNHTFLTETHPLTRPSMKDVVYIPSEGFIYCLDHSGDIYVFVTSGNPCKLLTVWKSTGLDCVSCCLTNYEYLVDGTPYSEADLDNLQVGMREDLSVKFLLVQAGGQTNQNILMAGCEDGSLVMFNRRYGRIDFRIQGHDSSVAHLVSNTMHSRVVSAGNDHVIRIWRMYPFAEEALAPMFSYYTVTTPKNLITGIDRVFYSYEKPDTCTFITVMHDLTDKKNKYPHNPDDDHTGAITCITVSESQRIFLSASVDSTIKIWNHNNKLVRTLVLNTIPSAITFGNHEGDILLSIKSEIRVVKFKTYLPEEYLKHMIGVQYPIEVSERPVPKSRGAKEQMSDLESTLPSGIRQNRDQVGYVPLSELKYRAQAETIKKSEIAKLMQRNFELEQLSQGKYDIKKFIRKTKKMRDNAFEDYFRLVYPARHSVTIDEDDDCFERGVYVGLRITDRADVGRRDSLVPTPIPFQMLDRKVLEKDLPSAPDGYKPNSCVRRAYRSPTPPPKSKKDKKKEWKLKKLTAAQMAELAAHLGNDELLEGRDWATETESSSTLSSPDIIEQEDESSAFSMTDESPTPPPPPPRQQSKVHSSRSKRSAKKTLVMQEDDDDEDDSFEPSDYMSKLQDIMAHVKPATPSPGPTPEPVSTPGSERPPSRKQVQGPTKPVKKFVSRPAPSKVRKKSRMKEDLLSVRRMTIPKITPKPHATEEKKADTPPPPPPDPLPEYIVLFQDEPWFRSYLPDPNPRTFPKASLTQFLQMILEAIPKAAFHVKAEICQAIGLIHTTYGIPIPTDVKIAILNALNGYPLPRVALPDEKQYILEALKLIQKLNVMDESVLAELLAQFIDGDDTVRELVMALLKARGLMNQNTDLETELDSWETWKLEGDPRRKAKLIEMAEEWCKEWKQRYNEFMANVGNEAKKSGKTVSEIMSMLSSPGTSPIVSIVNFFVYKCREKEELLTKSGGEPKKTTEGVRNAVISMPAIKKSNLMRLGESHRSKCYPERESTLSRFLPQLDPRTQSRINILLHGFTTYVNLALKPINVNPFAKPDNKTTLKEKTRPKSLNLLSPFKYFVPELATLSITDN
ncbi:uncharacterized protein LOC134826021 isoform X5 [Bolinopsis microptera]|uniref:uncharacterized protein LOC134826021 isoform X5 n=1 Tax=Bolinopsis microptera TaxID=2820187 RepID=UPI003078AA2F